MRQHFVTFVVHSMLSPVLVKRPIDSWDVRAAVAMIEHMKEKPHWFRFSTWLTHDPVPDGEGGTLNVEPRELECSGRYYTTGKVRSADERVADEVVHRRVKQPFSIDIGTSLLRDEDFNADDFVVDAAGAIVERGDASERAAYRAAYRAVGTAKP